MLLSEPQRAAYQRHWATPGARIRLVPPTLDPARRRPELRDDGTARARLRTALRVSDGAMLWLCVAAAARTKGVDRALDALAGAPHAVLAVAGIAAGSREGQHLTQQAARAGLADRLRLLGHREDVPELMAAADLLVHPARLDTTGTAILEAVANGLPVITTAICGYAIHVEQAAAGIVLPEPFEAGALAAALEEAGAAERRAAWRANGVRYGADPALTRGLDQAAAWITGPLW